MSHDLHMPCIICGSDRFFYTPDGVPLACRRCGADGAKQYRWATKDSFKPKPPPKEEDSECI